MDLVLMVSRSNASDMLRHDLAGPRVRTGFDIDRPEIAVVDSLSVTVITPVLPSMSTRPKICSRNRARGSRPAPRCSPSGHRFRAERFVEWSWPQVPACSGPETNSQNGSKS